MLGVQLRNFNAVAFKGNLQQSQRNINKLNLQPHIDTISFCGDNKTDTIRKCPAYKNFLQDLSEQAERLNGDQREESIEVIKGLINEKLPFIEPHMLYYCCLKINSLNIPELQIALKKISPRLPLNKDEKISLFNTTNVFINFG